jgi:hypothetical protein
MAPKSHVCGLLATHLVLIVVSSHGAGLVSGGQCATRAVHELEVEEWINLLILLRVMLVRDLGHDLHVLG